jgi:hypothetical protein
LDSISLFDAIKIFSKVLVNSFALIYIDFRGARVTSSASFKILLQALPGSAARGFLVYAAMPSITFQSRSYGLDPMKALEQKQNAEARQTKRPTLSLKRDENGWSPARQAAEALFDLPPRRSRSNGA